MKHPDLFISHSSADREAAEALVADLEKVGLTCWLAARDVSLGAAYQAAIVEAIDQCRAVLLVFSEAANRSEHVLREIELAAQGSKPVYPVRIDRSEPAGGLKYLLANKQWVERKAGDRLPETLVRLLMGATRAQPGDDGLRPPSQSSALRAGRPVVLAAAGLAVVVGVGVAAWLVGSPGPPRPGEATVSKARVEAPDSIVIAAGPDAPAPAPASPMPASPAPASPTSAPAPPAPVVPDPAPAVAPAAPEPAPVPPVRTAERPPPASAPDRGAEQPAPKGATPPQGRPPAEPVILASAPADAGALGPGVHLFRECDVCPVMAVVPPGRGLIGSPSHESGRNGSEGPQQWVAFTQAFAVGQTEITFEEWFACVAEGGCNAYRPGDYGWGQGKQPVINISWNDAKAYVAWLSRKTGKPYRLLSEAEWEYAARGCTSTSCVSKPFWFGSEITPARANYDWRFTYNASPKGQPPRRTVASDESEPNPFGLRHVHGNVREWVEDCWNSSLAGLPPDGSARNTGDCKGHVTRGGSWTDEPKDLRAAKRSWEVSGERRSHIGFRVSRSLAP